MTLVWVHSDQRKIYIVLPRLYGPDDYVRHSLIATIPCNKRMGVLWLSLISMVRVTESCLILQITSLKIDTCGTAAGP